MSDLLDRLEDATVEELDAAIDRTMTRLEVLTAARHARFGADIKDLIRRAKVARRAAGAGASSVGGSE